MELSLSPTRRRPNTTESRTVPKPFLEDFQWKLIADPFPEPLRRGPLLRIEDKVTVSRTTNISPLQTTHDSHSHP